MTAVEVNRSDVGNGIGVELTTVNPVTTVTASPASLPGSRVVLGTPFAALFAGRDEIGLTELS